MECEKVPFYVLSEISSKGMGLGGLGGKCWMFKKTGNTVGLLEGAEGSLTARESEFSKRFPFVNFSCSFTKASRVWVLLVK